MDEDKKTEEPKKEEGLGDIDIYLFSNGEVFSPPRKYHLTAQDLNVWDTTINVLARSQYGHSAIDLFNTEGQKIEGPGQLDNNSAYVAVDPKDQFQPGGYELYLMKASKSWLKRYGDSSTTSVIKNSAFEVPIPETTENTSELDKVKEDKNPAVVPPHGRIQASIDQNNEVTTKTRMNNDKGEKRSSSMARSSLPQKQISNEQQQGNDKKPQMPIKKKPGSPTKRNPLSNPNNATSTRLSRQLKTIYSPGKSRNIPSQLLNEHNLPPPNKNIAPELVVPARISVNTKSRSRNESILTKEINASKQLERLRLESILKKEPITSEGKSLQKQIDLINSPNDDSIEKEEVNTTKLIQQISGKYPDGLESVIEHVKNAETTIDNDHYPDIIPLKFGDVIDLRLCIEIKNNNTDSGNRKSITKVLPLTDNKKDQWNITINEKSSQVDLNEIPVVDEATKRILDGLAKKEKAGQYGALYCYCCQGCSYETSQCPERSTLNNNIKTLNKNNQDYVMILIPHANYEDFMGCKCDAEIPKYEKSAQTPTIDTERPRVSLRDTVDQTPVINRTSEIKNAGHLNIPLRDRASGRSEELFCSKVMLPRVFGCDCCPDIRTENQFYYSKVTPSLIITDCRECPECTSHGNIDESVQTDAFVFLLEARRKEDGHYSFHLPPLEMVKGCHQILPNKRN